MDNEEQFEYSETEALSEEFDEKTLKKLRKAELKRLVMSDLRQNADDNLLPKQYLSGILIISLLTHNHVL